MLWVILFFFFVYNIFKESFRFGLNKIKNNNEVFLETNNNKILDLNPLVCVYIYLHGFYNLHYYMLKCIVKQQQQGYLFFFPLITNYDRIIYITCNLNEFLNNNKKLFFFFSIANYLLVWNNKYFLKKIHIFTSIKHVKYNLYVLDYVWHRLKCSFKHFQGLGVFSAT